MEAKNQVFDLSNEISNVKKPFGRSKMNPGVTCHQLFRPEDYYKPIENDHDYFIDPNEGYWADSLQVRCAFHPIDVGIESSSFLQSPIKFTSASCLTIHYQHGNPQNMPIQSQLNFLYLNSFKIEQRIKIRCIKNLVMKETLFNFKKFNQNENMPIDTLLNDCQNLRQVSFSNIRTWASWTNFVHPSGRSLSSICLCHRPPSRPVYVDKAGGFGQVPMIPVFSDFLAG